jgi:hypothetical protein
MIDVEWEKNETAEVKMSWKAGGDTETICSFLEVGSMTHEMEDEEKCAEEMAWEGSGDRWSSGGLEAYERSTDTSCTGVYK